MRVEYEEAALGGLRAGAAALGRDPEPWRRAITTHILTRGVRDCRRLVVNGRILWLFFLFAGRTSRFRILFELYDEEEARVWSITLQSAQA